MKQINMRFISVLENVYARARLSLRIKVFYRCTVTLAIVSWAFGGCAQMPHSPRDAAKAYGDLPMCTGAYPGTGVMYYFDKNGALVSVDQRIEFLDTNSGENASKLIDKNKSTSYSHTKHVDKNNTGSAVFAIVSNDKCPVYQCVFPAKGTDKLIRDITDPGHEEDCRDKTCGCGVIPCGKYWCCKTC